MQHQQTGNGLYPLEQHFIPSQRGVELKLQPWPRAFFLFLLFCHSLLEGVYLPDASFWPALTLEPQPSLQIVLNQFPLLLLFRPNWTQVSFLTGDSEVIQKQKTNKKNTSKSQNTPDTGSGDATSLTAPAAVSAIVSQSHNHICGTYKLVLIRTLILLQMWRW